MTVNETLNALNETIRQQYDGRFHRGWILQYDNHTGGFWFENPEEPMTVYVTPGWEDYNGIAVSCIDYEGEYYDTLSDRLCQELYPEEFTGELNRDAQFVWDMMCAILDRFIRIGDIQARNSK